MICNPATPNEKHEIVSPRTYYFSGKEDDLSNN